MRNLLIVFLLLLLTGCATTLPPAGPDTVAMDRADAIWIQTADDPETAYRKIAQLITDNGYSISSSDAVLMNIATDYLRPKESFGEALSSGGMTVAINASVREHEQTVVKLTGKFSIPGTYGSEDNKIVSGGAKTSFTYRSWGELLKIAESYSGSTLLYSRNQ